MAGVSPRRKRHGMRKRRSKGPTAWLFTASVWIVPAVSGYVIYNVLTAEIPLSAVGTANASKSDPVDAIVPNQPGHEEQTTEAGSMLANPEPTDFRTPIEPENTPGATAATGPASGEMEILGPGWLLSQRRNAFTIQYMTSANMDELVDFSDGFTGGQPVTIYPFKQSGEVVSYGLARGLFDSVANARSALQNQPPALLQHKPWIRPVGQVSEQIKSFIGR